MNNSNVFGVSAFVPTMPSGALNTNVNAVSSFVPVMPSGALNTNVFGVSAFVPTMPSSGIFSPSGVLTQTQVLDFQNALVQLGHMPASAVTGREPVASAAVIRSFQQNYNAENRCRRQEPGAPCQPGRVYGPPLSPARISPENGLFGPQTQAALTNYLSYARSRAQSQVGSTVQSAPPSPNDVMGYGGAQVATIEAIGKPGVSTMVKGSDVARTPAVAPSPSRTPAAPAQTPSSLPGAGAGAGAGAGSSTSEIPWVPISIVAVGVLAIGGALYVRSSRKGRK